MICILSKLRIFAQNSKQIKAQEKRKRLRREKRIFGRKVTNLERKNKINMGVFTNYETKHEQNLRERNEKIISIYLSCASDIRSGVVKPHRVMCRIAEMCFTSRQNVAYVLTKAGIYKSASQPVISQRPTEAVQLSLNML